MSKVDGFQHYAQCFRVAQPLPFLGRSSFLPEPTNQPERKIALTLGRLTDSHYEPPTLNSDSNLLL
jgi:hypothetical protein